jgi:hypothetical protein
MARKNASRRTAPPPGTAENAAWRKKISSGMRRAKARRRSRGLLSFMETAVFYSLPMRFVKNAVKQGKLRAISVGSRSYVRTEDAEAVFGKRVA